MQNSFQINDLCIINFFNMNISSRLLSLRTYMKDHKVDAFIIPSSDPHMSEYVADHWKSREWISGFTGSAGTVLITQNYAGLWTDSRYFIQAINELENTEIELNKIIDRTSLGYTQWIIKNLPEGSIVGVNGFLFSEKSIRRMESKFEEKNIKLVTSLEPIQEIWNDRKELPTQSLFELPMKFSGKSFQDKLAELQKHLFVNKAEAILFTTLDEIAWLLNIRSSDIDFNPVAICYLLVTVDENILFIDDRKISNSKIYFDKNKIQVRPYHNIVDYLVSFKRKVLVDPNTCSTKLFRALDQNLIQEKPSFVIHEKAIKNSTEIEGFRNAMIKDGVALCHVYHWLETNIENGITEYEFGNKIAEFRSQQKDYFGESFNPIIGNNGNGAIIHYRADETDCAAIEPDGYLLCDSGAQFMDGTTDITRSFSFGKPSEKYCKAYTLVLAGHIDLALASFPVGTKGVQLDLLARKALWEHSMDYPHGTGHGVGSFLNVHEEPQGFAPGNSNRGNARIFAGMVTSNEPGYYKLNEFGIRIENLVLSCDKGDGFINHETITLYPIQTKPIIRNLLSPAQIKWLNDYHKLVWEKLSPHLDKELQDWLYPQCQSL